MKKLMIALILLGFSGLACSNIVHLKARGGSGSGAKGIKPVLFDDYEGEPGQAYSYGDTANGGVCDKPEVTTEDKHSGEKSLKIKYTTGTGTWGCGFDTFSGKNPEEGYFDVEGAIGIEMWARFPVGVTLQPMLKEGKGNGGDDEVYLFPEITGNGRWKKYFVRFELASRGIYSGNQSGDDELATGSIASINFQLNASQGDGVLYIDDVYFR